MSLSVLVLLASSTLALECFTGDGDTMRRKKCPTFGAMDFSDRCYKKIDDSIMAMEEDVQRGCFNSVIGAFIVESPDAQDDGSDACFDVPRKYGEGRICLCRNELCNAASNLTSTALGILIASLLFALLL